MLCHSLTVKKIRTYTHLLLLVNLIFSWAYADDINIAVASNFTVPMEKIARLYQNDTGNKLTISYGSTAKLFAQIKAGAPFVIFLSGDQEHPKKLVQENLALAETQFTYGIGKLVLWSAKPKVVDYHGEVLNSKKIKHIALANPKLAPYGAAAQQVLENKNLWKALAPQLVYGENIAQTYQFISTGSAEIGFIALSQIRNTVQNESGSYWAIPQDLYEPLKQDAILLMKAKDNNNAKKFLEYLKNSKIQSLIKENGYDL